MKSKDKDHQHNLEILQKEHENELTHKERELENTAKYNAAYITPEDYLQTKGQDYRNTPFLQVYSHSGEPCPSCVETLIRTVIGGRSGVYCPKCQGEKR